MNRRLPPSLRRLVLGGALLVATLCAIVPDAPPARAAEAWPTGLVVAQASTDAARDAAAERGRLESEAARREATRIPIARSDVRVLGWYALWSPKK